MEHAWLAVLCFALMAGLLVASWRERWVVGFIFKALASSCFVALGILGCASAPDPVFAQRAAAGLCLGAVADIAINLRYVLPARKTPLFLAGMAAFFAGHLCYIWAAWPRCPLPWALVAAGALLTVPLMRWIFSRIEAPRAIKAAGSLYIGTVVCLSCVAVAGAVARPSFGRCAFAAGAVLFLASDVVHTLHNFGHDKRFSQRVLNLSLYYAAQLLIAFSVQLP